MEDGRQQTDWFTAFGLSLDNKDTPQNEGERMQVYTKESLIESLREIRSRGWLPSTRPGNAGAVGNTLEDLLGITENNLPIPNANEWELKCQRTKSKSLCTLFHSEPSPTALRFVPKMLLPLYGWPHAEAGMKYPSTEMSFRQTISAAGRSSRGFKVVVDRDTRRVAISFDANAVAQENAVWLAQVAERVGLGELMPQPYWGFDDLRNKTSAKLHNCFYVYADTRKQDGVEYFRYTRILMLEGFNLEGLLQGLEQGQAYVDFDARTGHNHGTKFRLQESILPKLYGKWTEID